MRHFVILLLGFVATLLSGLARAEPYLAVDQGIKCNACHVNPTGGGLRNAFGAVFTQHLLPAYKLPEAVPAWSGSIVDRLRVGADLRARSLRTREPNQPETVENGLDHFRFYVDAQLIRDHVGVYLDEQLRPGHPVRQEAYVRLTTADQRWYAKAGQFYLPFGWRLQDSNAFVRSLSGISMASPDKGFELGLETDEWSVQIASSNGPSNVGPNTGSQLTGQAVWVQPDWRVGLAVARTKSSAGDRMVTGLFGGLRTGPLAWLGEVDLVGDEGFPEGKRRQLAALGEVNWKVRQGHNLKYTAELLDPNRAAGRDHKVRYSLLYELTPIPFVQLRVGYRRFGGVPQNDFDNRRVLLLELHTFM
jgi:hypothetical protein